MQRLLKRRSVTVLVAGVLGIAATMPVYQQVFAQPTIDLGRLNAQADSGANGNGKTALMLAAKNRELDLVQALLAVGADVNRKNNNGGTPLMYAVLGGDAQIVKLLLDHDVEVDATAKNGWSAIMIAAAKGYVDIAGMLLEQGADPNLRDVYRWTPLMRASFEDRPLIVERLLEDVRTEINWRGDNGMTALHLAVDQGRVEIVRLLLVHGADTSIQDNAGRTAYAIAIKRRQAELVTLLEG